LRERINDGYTLRNFTGFYSQPVPKHNAFNYAFNRLRPATMKTINDMMIKAAVADGLEDGKKLRVDTTVVETDVHWPTDATLLWDVVRVLVRLIGRLREIVPQDVPRFPNRKREARRRVLEQEQVPTSEKLYSIFEPHTDLIKRGKVNKPVEFGHKVFLAESAQGLITQYRVLKGHPCDEDHVKPTLDNHNDTFGF